MRGIVISNNELEEYNARYNNVEVESSNFSPLNNTKRPLPKDMVTSETRRKDTIKKAKPIVTTKDNSAVGHPLILKRVRVKIFGMMDGIDDDTACPWFLPLDQYTDIPEVGSIVDVVFPDSNNWSLGYYTPIEETTSVSYLDIIKKIADSYTILDDKEKESSEYKDVEKALDKVSDGIEEAQGKYDEWVSNATKSNYGISSSKKDYNNWIKERDKLKDLVDDFNKEIEKGKRSDKEDNFGNLFGALETLPTIGIYPSNKVFNLSKNVKVECDDTDGSEKYTVYFKKTGDYLRLDSNGSILKSSKDIRLLAEENMYIRGKELQFTTVSGNDILLTEDGVVILDKNQNLIKTTKKGIEITSFSTEKKKNTILMKKTGMEIEDKNGNTIKTTLTGITLNDKLFVPT